MSTAFFEIYPNMEIESQGKSSNHMKLKDGISLPQVGDLGHFLDPMGGKHPIMPRKQTVYSGKSQHVTHEGRLPHLTNETIPYPISYTSADKKEHRYFIVTDNGSLNPILKPVPGPKMYEEVGEQQSHFVTEIDHFKYLKLVRKLQDHLGHDEVSQ